MLELCLENMAVPLSNKLRNTRQAVALDTAPAEPRMRVDPWLGGPPTIQNTETCCRFFQTRVRSPDTRRCSESTLWGVGAISPIIIRGPWLSSRKGHNRLSTPLSLAPMWPEVLLSLIPKPFTGNNPRLDPPTCYLHSPAPLDLSQSYHLKLFTSVFFRIFTH